jgi:hypothetical protein
MLGVDIMYDKSPHATGALGLAVRSRGDKGWTSVVDFWGTTSALLATGFPDASDRKTCERE